jgi:N-glycosylase/DNA lyase
MTAITLRPDQLFNLDATLSCGQAFRWEAVGDRWHGVVNGYAVCIRQDGNRLIFDGAGEGFVRDYFRLDQDLSAILASINRDPTIDSAIRCCCGLRIVRQQPWECLVSYICATNTNIPAVKRRISLLSERHGDEIEGPFGRAYTFPEPDVLVSVRSPELRDCKLGYRADYVRDTAAWAVEHPDWAERIAALPFEDARQELMHFRGVGPKAADCVLLFAFGIFEAFPVDVWIRRIMAERYLPELGERSCTPAEYDRIRRFAREYFGEYAGYAQEYLFCARGSMGDFGTTTE